jgi:CelD/BcsL family acetyltransferase involved in cellulose biosynthesis
MPAARQDQSSIHWKTAALHWTSKDHVRSVTYDALAPLADEWEELAEEFDAPPFVRLGWIAAWWEAFGTGRLQLCVVLRQGRLVGIAPMYRHRRTLRSTSNAHTPEFGLLAVDEAVADALAAHIYAGTRRVLVELVASTDDAARLRSAARDVGYRFVRRAPLRSPVLEIEGQWDDYERSLGRRIMTDLRRRARRLADFGVPAVDVHDGRERLPELLDAAFALEHSGWKAARGTSIEARPETKLFYTSVARWAAERGWLRLAFLTVGGRAVAFQYGLEHARTYYFLKGGYDRAFARFAPGRLLLQRMIERAFTESLTRFEFLGADEPWKLEWTQGVRERVTVDAFAPSALGALEWATHSSARIAAGQLRKVLASTTRGR